jgi:hypothetical protein
MAGIPTAAYAFSAMRSALMLILRNARLAEPARCPGSSGLTVPRHQAGSSLDSPVWAGATARAERQAIPQVTLPPGIPNASRHITVQLPGLSHPRG